MTKADLTPSRAPGIVAGRLGSAALAAGFADLHPPLSAHEARVAADRCYFCHDAPCTIACPTAIDIPLFIKQSSGEANLMVLADNSFSMNIAIPHELYDKNVVWSGDFEPDARGGYSG